MKEILRFGLKNDVLVSIDDVESGLKCNCLCPSCGAQLIARKGKINENHFAHYRIADCGHAAETALHKMAKDIITETKTVYIENKDGSLQCLSFDNAEQEKQLSPHIRSDVWLTSEEAVLNVEILVTHSVDDAKKQQLLTDNIPTLEIDLSPLIDDFTEDDVREAIVSGAHSEWIYRKENAIERIGVLFADSYDMSLKSWYCPSIKRRTTFTSGRHGCNDCMWYLHRASYLAIDCGFGDIVQCEWRSRQIRIDEIDEVSDVVRENGIVTSCHILRNGKWQLWAGTPTQQLQQQAVSSEKIMKRHRCCFESPNVDEPVIEAEVSNIVTDKVLSARRNGFTTFLCGTSSQFDIAVAETILKIKKRDPVIKFICVVPNYLPLFEEKHDYGKRLHDILAAADHVKKMEPELDREDAIEKLNGWAAEHCDKVVLIKDIL